MILETEILNLKNPYKILNFSLLLKPDFFLSRNLRNAYAQLQPLISEIVSKYNSITTTEKKASSN